MDANQKVSNVQDMIVFANIIEQGSFTKAATHLGLSTSSVSRSVSRLEKNLRCRLINRTTRKQQLTSTGLEIYQQCKQLSVNAEAVYQISTAKKNTPNGLVKIAVPRALGIALIDPILQRFMSENPSVKIQLKMTDQRIDLIEDDIDLLIRFSNNPPSGLIGRKLITSKACLVASPSYLNDNAPITSPKDLIQHQCLPIYEDAYDLHWRFKKGQQRISIQVSYQYAVNHASLRLELAKQGQGVAVVPSFIAKPQIQTNQLVEVLSDWQLSAKYAGDVWLLQSAHRYHNPATKALYHYLAEHLS